MQGNWNQSNSYMMQYVVKPGDSLYMIAKAHGITVDELKNANHLVSNVIYPNQVLLIPKYSNCDKTYMTELGDSIKNILTRHNITIDDLAFYNCKNHVLSNIKHISICHDNAPFLVS